MPQGPRMGGGGGSLGWLAALMSLACDCLTLICASSSVSVSLFCLLQGHLSLNLGSMMISSRDA